MKKISILIIVLIISFAGYSQTAEDYYNSGIEKQKQENLNGAIADFTMAIEINPNYDKAYFYRGLDKLQLKDNKGAIIDFTKALTINSNYYEAYINRGFAKYNLMDYQGAISDYTFAIVINPQNGHAYYLRGMSKLTLFLLDKSYDKGCLDLNKAGELGYGEAYDIISKYCQ